MSTIKLNITWLESLFYLSGAHVLERDDTENYNVPQTGTIFALKQPHITTRSKQVDQAAEKAIIESLRYLPFVRGVSFTKSQ